MRNRVAVLAASAAMIVSTVVVGPAAAAPATWTVTPGGDYSGIAGDLIIEFQGSGVQFVCENVELSGTAKSGSGLSNPLATITDSAFQGGGSCSGPFGLGFEIDHVGIWTFHGVSYDPATGVTTAIIDDVVLDLRGPGCAVRLTGHLDATYTNSTHELRVLPNYTILVTVDPVENCLGLINSGGHVSFDGVFDVNPPLTISLQP